MSSPIYKYALVNYKGEMEQDEIETLEEAESLASKSDPDFYTQLHVERYDVNSDGSEYVEPNHSHLNFGL